MSDADYAARLAQANDHIDAFIRSRRDGAEALLSVAEQAKKEEAARTLAELSRGPPRPDTPNVTGVDSGTPGVKYLGQIGLSQFTPDQFPSIPNKEGGRKSRSKSKRKSKSRKSRR